MVNHQRKIVILKHLTENTSARVSELSDYLNVSDETIRRDLDKLQKEGVISRFHGGAMMIEKASPEPPVVLRISENAVEKKRIGAAAANLVEDGDTIFVGSGTTAGALAEKLKGRKNITVITNSLLVIDHLSKENGISLISTGGMLRESEFSFIGYLMEKVLNELCPNKVFLGIRAVSLESGLTNDYLPEVTTDRVIIYSAPEVILLADHTKFDKISTAFVAPLTSVNKIITDKATPKSITSGLISKGIEVILV